MKHLSTSLVWRVAQAIARRGTATVDDLTADFPQHTRAQVHAALGNAKAARLIRVKVQGCGLGPALGRKPSVWEAAPAGQEPPRRMRDSRPVVPPASVWELGADRPRAKWPPPFHGGRPVCTLGPWSEA